MEKTVGNIQTDLEQAVQQTLEIISSLIQRSCTCMNVSGVYGINKDSSCVINIYNTNVECIVVSHICICVMYKPELISQSHQVTCHLMKLYYILRWTKHTKECILGRIVSVLMLMWPVQAYAHIKYIYALISIVLRISVSSRLLGQQVTPYSIIDSLFCSRRVRWFTEIE